MVCPWLLGPGLKLVKIFGKEGFDDISAKQPTGLTGTPQVVKNGSVSSHRKEEFTTATVTVKM